MIKKALLLIFISLLLNQSILTAQTSSGGTPPSFSVKDIPAFYESQVLNKPDLSFITTEDLLRDKNGMFYRAGVSVPVQINTENSGTWHELPNGDRIWRLRITAPDALALGVYYDHFWLPPGGHLYLYDQSGEQILGAYTEKNNSEEGSFVTELVRGESLTLEYLEPSRTWGMAVISISELAYVYRGVKQHFGQLKDYGDSESCEVDINCPEGANWQDEKKGVARIFLKAGTSYGWCTGTLINNVNQDCTPYFLTADHCGNLSSTADLNVWVFYFNYEAATCNYTGAEPTSVSMTGCTLKAHGGDGGDSGSDFYLVELSSAPTFSPYFNGWNRANTPTTGGVGIHHPAGDIKKISTFTGALTSDSWGTAANSHWRVTWTATATNHGVTEGGSSGSPLFNNTGLIVGDLTGGGSSCSSLTSPDMYGKFSYSWDMNGATAATRLKDWLDPANTGAMTLNGYYCGSTPTLDADFSASATAIPVGGTIDFTDLTTGTPTTWSWTFTGGTPATSTIQNPASIQYNTAGVYAVSLTVGDGTSTDTETKTNYITVGDPPPSADFVANATIIPVGGNVNFTDLSGGIPTSWSWTFSGGTPATSTAQHPSGIVYSAAGTYTVSLTATNAQGSDTETKVNYITVGGGTPGEYPCDTLNYPLPGMEVLYSVRYTNGIYGYVSGNNGYSDKAKANFFYPTSPHLNLHGAYLKFGKAKKRSGYDSKVIFAVWDNSGPGGAPGITPLVTDTVMLSTIVSQVSGHQMTYVDFSELSLSTPFYLGVYLPEEVGDTLALITNKNGQTVPANAWEQWQNGIWYNYSDSTSWDYDLSHAIFPVLCTADFNVQEFEQGENIMVYPNPANSVVNIDFGPVSYEQMDVRVYNLMGALVASRHHEGSATNIIRLDVEDLSAGFYTLQLSSGTLNVVRKISIIK